MLAVRVSSDERTATESYDTEHSRATEEHMTQYTCNDEHTCMTTTPQRTSVGVAGLGS